VNSCRTPRGETCCSSCSLRMGVMWVGGLRACGEGERNHARAAVGFSRFLLTSPTTKLEGRIITRTRWRRRFACALGRTKYNAHGLPARLPSQPPPPHQDRATWGIHTKFSSCPASNRQAYPDRPNRSRSPASAGAAFRPAPEVVASGAAYSTYSGSGISTGGPMVLFQLTTCLYHRRTRSTTMCVRFGSG